jgi:GT2 family glycosyltransferase
LSAIARAALDATILVCSRNRPRMLAETVASILEGERVPSELLVVDQSTDAHAELAALGSVRGCDVSYLHTSSSGLSRARNIGLRAARCEVVVLLDDDMLVERDWLERLLAGHAAGGPRAVATGRVLAGPDEGDGGTVPPAALVTRATPAVYRGRQPTDVVPGANVALYRAVALALGGYDERLGAGARFGSADDNDMGLRLLDAGCEVRHVPDAVVLHRAWRTPRGRALMRWTYGRGKGAFYAKHMRRGDRYALARMRADTRARVRAVRRGLPRAPAVAAGHVLYLAGMLSGAAEWLLRERLPSRRAHATGD